MCGRYQLKDPKAQYVIEFSIKGPVPNWRPRVNFSPTNHGPFVISQAGERSMRVGHWGLIPKWSKEPKMGYPTFNARADSVREKPSFREAFVNRRCLVPMDAFYEWSGPKSNRIPHEISRLDEKPMAMAGLWEVWKSRTSDETVTSFTIITTTANGFMSEIHSRMPVMLEKDQYEDWMTASPNDAFLMMQPAPEGLLKERLVNKGINVATNEGDWLLDVAASKPDLKTEETLL